jgi:hypothetical protein
MFLRETICKSLKKFGSVNSLLSSFSFLIVSINVSLSLIVSGLLAQNVNKSLCIGFKDLKLQKRIKAK